MATTPVTSVRTATDHHRSHAGRLLTTYVGLVVGSVALATGAAVVLAGFTTGLGSFVLLAGGWLALVSASPALAERGTARVAAGSTGRRATRSNRAVRALLTDVFTR